MTRPPSPPRFRLCAALVALTLAGALPAGAQTAPPEDLVALVADDVRITGRSTLVATGNVEMRYQGYHLRARRVSYDQATDMVAIEGPLVLTEGDDEVVLASSADLSDDLREGVIRSARIVLNHQLQIAANEVARSGGRYTRMTRAVASSCEVCPGGRQVPLWEIRAARVTHDEDTRQIYFDRAQFRVAGVPLAYLPRLRVPDPSVERYSGFLLPIFSSSSNLGSGFSLPWFQVLGPDRDLTLSPFISTKGAELLESRYRQAFGNGWIDMTAAVAHDRLSSHDGGLRLYVFGDGAFALPQDFRLDLGVAATSDANYLSDYDITEDDRLANFVTIQRARRNELITLDTYLYQTLRPEEDQDTIGSTSIEGNWRHRFRPGGWIGGQGEWALAAHTHRRASTQPWDGPDPDRIADGRDVLRLSLNGDWRRDWLMDGGLVYGVEGALRGDAYWIDQDASADRNLTRAVPTVATDLRWPLVRTTQSGAREVVEPMVQAVWTPTGIRNPLNEDSTLVEFDEGNLFALSRYPGVDAQEEGFRINVGGSWTHYAPEGWLVGLTLGRVFRIDDRDQFAPSTGLDGAESDWLVAARFDWDAGVSLVNRILFDDDFTISRNEFRIDWERGRLDLASSYVWLEEDLVEDRDKATSEWAVAASWDVSERWTATTRWRYDFTASRAVRTDLGFVWRNECVEVDASISRRYRSWDSDDETTRFSLSVELLGFGRSDRPRLARQCTG